MSEPKELKNDQPIIAFADSAAWERWLAANQSSATGVWLKIAKKGSETTTVSYAEAVDVALCYGWIDGQSGAYDDSFWLQRYTARTPRSKWSQINRDKVAALVEAGRMQPPGLAAVEAARADGRWAAAYEPPSKATVPADLQTALDANLTAAAVWAELDGANRYAVLYRVQDAKRPETRARRIEKFVGMLSRGEKIHR
ncbi:MAG: YdeI/OmpD-associated family protein [Geodermatophilaceae bacterium]|nr:YdeI/OmpD-associated family protein [Geodermatophilaceae bacterium]